MRSTSNSHKTLPCSFEQLLKVLNTFFEETKASQCLDLSKLGYRMKSEEDAYSSHTHDPTFACIEGPCCSTFDFEFSTLNNDYVLHIFNFAF